MRLAIEILAGVAVAVVVIAVGNRVYTEAELHANTQDMAKMYAERAQAESLAQANLADRRVPIRQD
jgi:hypothetical protein